MKIEKIEKDFEKERWRLNEENKSLKERLDVLRRMNFYMQKLLNVNIKKAH